jgi:hypothetical protein
MRATCPAYLIPFELIYLMIFMYEYKLWSSSVFNFLKSPVTLSVLCPSFLLRNLFSHTLSIYINRKAQTEEIQSIAYLFRLILTLPLYRRLNLLTCLFMLYVRLNSCIHYSFLPSYYISRTVHPYSSDHPNSNLVIQIACPVWWPGLKNSPTVNHACRKIRLKWVPSAWGCWATLSPGVWSSRLGVGRWTNNPAL